MIKFICDKCGKEFTTQNSICQILTKDRKDLLLSSQKGRQQVLPNTEEKIYHLCLECRNEFFVTFKSLK